MWSPTHIQVTIHSARGVLIKGKAGTNNCFVTIGLGKEKFQTSVQKNATANVEWREECELRIPDRGNRAELVLTCLHKGAVVDDFLGQVTLPLNEMDVYERPRQRWYRLESKPGQEKKDKQRGELEVRIAFTVNPETGSVADLSKKEKGSRLGLGGSLLSLADGEKRNKMKNFAKSLGSRMHISGKPKRDASDTESMSGSVLSVNRSHTAHEEAPRQRQQQQQSSSQPRTGQLGSVGGFGASRLGGKQPNIDPGVVSDEEDDFVFDNMSHKSSGSSLNAAVRSSQQHLSGGLPPPSPLSTHSSAGLQHHSNNTNGTSNGHNGHNNHHNNNSSAEADDVKLRSQTLPPPSKPPRVAGDPPAVQPRSQPPKVDEWESKLYGGGGKHLDIGSSADSLKRRSWESSRVIPISVTPPVASAASGVVEHGLSSTAPTTPNLEDQKRVVEHIEKPRPLPRSATLESIEERDRDDRQTAAATASVVTSNGGGGSGSEKTEKRFLHKLKYFQRKDRAESAEDLKSAGRPVSQQFGERIIIGHENDLVRHGGSGGIGGAAGVGRAEMAHVSPELLKKYDGKTREDMLVLANDLENEVKSQRLKMKEMEDYLDDLLLRVMETHPKILQNPYRNQMSAKSG